jgi:hypothetical protein
MYATGVGLVLRGFQKLKAIAPDEINQPLVTPELEPEKPPVTGHSIPGKQSSWLEKLLEKTRQIFDEDAQ